MRHAWRLWGGEIPEEKVNSMVNFAKTLPVQDAKTFGNNEGDKATPSLRKSKVRWIHNTEVKDFLWSYVQAANVEAFGLDLQNFSEVQFTEYHATDNGHYDWHHDVDWSGERACDRKLSLVVQLSDPSEYEGGDFQFKTVQTPGEDFKRRGSVLVFPSYFEHRVTPVTHGRRYSLVAWFYGPRWR